jgi:hypothetical protein
VTLVLYGILCRLLGIYFFWESGTFGWEFLFAWLSVYLIQRVKRKKNANRRTVWEKIGIFLSLMILVLIVAVNIIFNFADATRAAKTYIANNDALKQEIGDIRGFGFTYGGSVEERSDSAGTTGTADFEIIVKGERKFRQVEIYLVKENKAGWEVKAIR